MGGLTAPDDPGGVWCRKCGSLEYETERTYPCLEGVVRVHRCGVCGKRFGSVATHFDTGTEGGDAAGRFTRLAWLSLPVQQKG